MTAQPQACAICGGELTAAQDSPFIEAGEWLAGEVWQDAGTLCPTCLENRARLSMMYLHDYNT